MKNFIRTKRICILFVYLLILMPAHAQSIWDKTNLEKVKQQIDQPAYQTAYNALLERAEQALKQSLTSGE